ncbi:uncharacterized protein [Diadema setosum]|uniref:uncharacterized protein n=1 Tax=Diadema setosum TaxID=31175 RepID=UPI003B3B2E36
MNVKCYEEIPSVKLVGGPSPLDGLVVLESDRYVCYKGFNLRAADLVCRELGFPAVKDYTAEIIQNTATSYWTRFLSYSTSCQRVRIKDCLSNRTECNWNKAVRLRCQKPGFLVCSLVDRHTSQASVSGFNIQSDGECVSTCRQNPEDHDIVIVSSERSCSCYRSEEYANNISRVSYSFYWTSETKVDRDQQVHCLFNLSVGFCKHPSPVFNGYWDSHITSFGSRITLSCDKGFMLNGNATLECVALTGWSTYFPVWNASIPSSLAVENATNGLSYNSSSSEWQPTEELTTFQKTFIMTSSESGHLHKNITVGLYILGTFLFLVLILLVTFSVAWYKHHKKSNKRRPSQAWNQRLQMQPVDAFNQHLSSADHVELNTTGSDAEVEGRPFLNHPGITFTDVTAHEEDPRHIYQDATEGAKGASQPSGGEHISPDAFSSQTYVDTTVTTSLTSVDIPNIHNCKGMEGISLDQTENDYEDCTYQDVDIDRNNWVKESASRSHGGACLFDDTCYNVLNFTNRSDSVFSKSQDPRIASVSNAKRELENESAESYKSGDFAKSKNISKDNIYERINRAFHDDREQVHHPSHPAICPTQTDFCCNRRESNSFSSTDPRTAAPSEDVYYFQLDPGVPKDIETIDRPYHPDVFDSTEYSSLNPEKNSINRLLPNLRQFDNFTKRHDAETPMSDELYARVNKTRGAALSPKPAICQELYAKVDKTKKECNIDANETKGPSLSDDPVMCEELYANVAKTRDSCTVDTNLALSEGMYMNFTDM